MDGRTSSHAFESLRSATDPLLTAVQSGLGKVRKAAVPVVTKAQEAAANPALRARAIEGGGGALLGGATGYALGDDPKHIGLGALAGGAGALGVSKVRRTNMLHGLADKAWQAADASGQKIDPAKMQDYFAQAAQHIDAVPFGREVTLGTKLGSSNEYYRQHRSQILARQRAYRRANKQELARKKRIYNRKVRMGARRQQRRMHMGQSYKTVGWK